MIILWAKDGSLIILRNVVACYGFSIENSRNEVAFFRIMVDGNWDGVWGDIGMSDQLAVPHLQKPGGKSCVLVGAHVGC